MGLKTAKDYLESYKRDTANQYINVCTFLELLIDFEQTNLEEITTYLNISSFPSTTTLYKKNRGYISPKGDNKNDCQSTCNFFDEIHKTTSFSVITGFSYEVRERYASLYFSLLELFQSDALKHVNFTKKYAAHEAMGKGFGYLSKGSIGSLFRSNELVTGLPQQRIDELITIGQIAKVEIDSKTNLATATDMQKIVIAKIHEYMDAQMKSYNSSPSHRDEISNFIAQSNDDEAITQTDKELIEKLQDKVADLENQLAQAKAELANNPADEVELNPKTQTAVTRLLNVLFHKAQLDITAHKGTTNKNIVNSSISLNAKITEKPVSHWIKQVQQLRIDTEKR